MKLKRKALLKSKIKLLRIQIKKEKGISLQRTLSLKKPILRKKVIFKTTKVQNQKIAFSKIKVRKVASKKLIKPLVRMKGSKLKLQTKTLR